MSNEGREEIHIWHFSVDLVSNFKKAAYKHPSVVIVRNATEQIHAYIGKGTHIWCVCYTTTFAIENKRERG